MSPIKWTQLRKIMFLSWIYRPEYPGRSNKKILNSMLKDTKNHNKSQCMLQRVTIKLLILILMMIWSVEMTFITLATEERHPQPPPAAHSSQPLTAGMLFCRSPWRRRGMGRAMARKKEGRVNGSVFYQATHTPFSISWEIKKNVKAWHDSRHDESDPCSRLFVSHTILLSCQQTVNLCLLLSTQLSF